MRLIDADEIHIDLAIRHIGDEWFENRYSADDIGDFIREQPTVDAVPVMHGRWIPVHSEIAVCSICGHVTGGLLTNYCPNCGAKMDGEAVG